MCSTSNLKDNGKMFPGMLCTEDSISTPNLTPSTTTTNSSFSSFSDHKSNSTITTSVPNTPSKKHNPPNPSPHRSKIDTNYLNRLPSSCKNNQSQFFFSSPCNSPIMSRRQTRTPTTTPNTQRSKSTCFFTADNYNETPTDRQHSYNYNTIESPNNKSLFDNVLDHTTLHNNTSYDRYIPSRKYSNLYYSAISPDEHVEDDPSRVNLNPNRHESSETNNNPSPTNENQNQETLLQTLLQNELLNNDPRQVLRFNPTMNKGSIIKPFNISLDGEKSFLKKNKHLLVSQKRKRRISKVPFKVLDAPALQDDFYLNLVDWSSNNVLAVGLASCVYLWSACTSKVTKLCDLSQQEDIVTSVAWSNQQRGTQLAIGTNRGDVQIWDTIACKKIRTMIGHSARTGTLSWSNTSSNSLLVSGSRDRLIHVRDTRVQDSFVCKLACHKQEVCGLKFSYDEPTQLASGGNDNKLLIWDLKMTSAMHQQPVHKFTDHTAAVKAIAWSPHQHGLVCSGGGTADRCIRFWNTLNNSSCCERTIDTGSQVCNLAWSSNCNEIVSTHGYSLNQIVVWSYPTMNKVTTLTGHTYRVLYLAVSPDGSTIVTGAGDETLRFWQVFPGPRSMHDKGVGNSLLFPSTPTLR